MDMHMSFYFSSTVYDFLFEGVNVTTKWGMVSLCLGLVLLAVLSEGFKVARSQLLTVATQPRPNTCAKTTRNERVKWHVVQSVLHVLHLSVGYVLMLVVMTYNAYFTFAVVGGAALGYFLFAVFDLPAKVLGTSRSPVKTSEGNGACGLAVASASVGSSSNVASSSNVGGVSLDRAERVVVPVVVECVRGGAYGAPDGARLEAQVDVSDTEQLLPQETIQVEVHAYTE